MKNNAKLFTLNVFLMKSEFDRDEKVLSKELKSIEIKEVKIGNSYIGKLYLNPIKERVPAWIDLFKGANIPELNDLKTKSVAAVLLVQHEGRIFALVFGYGRHLLNLVSCQPCNVAIDMLYYLHNQPRRIEYEEIHCDT